MPDAAIEKALADSQRSYTLAKASVADAAADVLSSGSYGQPYLRNHSMTDAERLRAYRGWVWTALRPICTSIAGQPIRMGSTARLSAKQPDNVRILQTHQALDTLNDPSDLFTAWHLKFCWAAGLGLVGKSHTWITTVDGRRQALYIPAHWIVGFEGKTSYANWIVRPPGSARDFPIPSEQMIYMSLPDPSSPYGSVGPLQAVAASVEADEHLQLAQRDAFRRGLLPTHLLTVGKHAGPDGSVSSVRPQLTGQQRRQILRAIRTIWRDTSTNGDPLILDGLIESCTRLTSTPQEMDFLKSGEALKKRVMQAFGTSPAIVGEELTNLASSRAAMDHFARFTVNPLLAQMSACLQEWYLPIVAPKEPNLRIWIEPVVVQDEELQLRRMQILGQLGVVSADELRAWAGLPPLAGQLGVFPITPAAGIQDLLERQMEAQAMVTSRMIVQDVVDRRMNGKEREHA